MDSRFALLSVVALCLMTGCASSVQLNVVPEAKAVPQKLLDGLPVALGAVEGPPCFREEVSRYLALPGGLRLAAGAEQPRLTVSGRVHRIEAHSNRGDKEVLVLYYSAFVFTAPLAAAVYAAKDWQADAIAEGELSATDSKGQTVWSRVQAVSVSEVQRSLPTNEALKSAMLAAGCQKLATTLLNGLAEAAAGGELAAAKITGSGGAESRAGSPPARSQGLEDRLDALEDLLKRGKITSEEFGQLRRRVIEAPAPLSPMPPPSGRDADTERSLEEQLEIVRSMSERGRINADEVAILRRRTIESVPLASIVGRGTTPAQSQPDIASTSTPSVPVPWLEGEWKRTAYAGTAASLVIGSTATGLTWQFSDMWGDTTHHASGTGTLSGITLSLIGRITTGDARNVGTPLRLLLRREGSVLTGTLTGGSANFSADYIFEKQR